MGIGVGVGVRVLVGVGVKIGVGVEVGVELGVLVNGFPPRVGGLGGRRGVLVGVGVGVKGVQLTHNPTRRQRLMSFHAGSLTGIGFTSPLSISLD